MKKFQYIMLAAVAVLVLASCEKVSPIGVLVSGTGVEDRVKMSHIYFQEHKGDYNGLTAPDGDEYTFLVGADSHMTNDTSRMAEMLQNGLDHDDVLYAHLGDIADTKAEYYINLEDVIDDYKLKFAKKYYKEVNLLDSLEKYASEDYAEDGGYTLIGESIYYEDEKTGANLTLDQIQYPFFPVVGNHDITHNGWALWSNIFHSSFYDVYVYVGEIDGKYTYDHFIFLDTANGTLGKEQVNLIEAGLLDDKYYEQSGIYTRNTFVFSHTNIFRPSSLQFASTFAREETFFLLNQFIDSMSENNNPGPGDYLVRVHVKRNGDITWERVHMNTKKK